MCWEKPISEEVSCSSQCVVYLQVLILDSVASSLFKQWYATATEKPYGYYTSTSAPSDVKKPTSSGTITSQILFYRHHTRMYRKFLPTVCYT